MLQGQAHARLDFNIVDSDCHVTEPPHVWQSRVPQKLKERAPKVVKLPNGGDAWSYEDGKHVRPLWITNSTAGVMSTDINPDVVLTYETIRPSHYDSKARVQDMDLDGIHAEVVYPLGPGAYGDDRELILACTRAYNDWMVEEFSGPSDNRLFVIATVPTTGIEDALAEVERSMKKGHTGVNLSRWPNGSQMPSPEDDRFWAMAEDMNLPRLHPHWRRLYARTGWVRGHGARSDRSRHYGEVRGNQHANYRQFVGPGDRRTVPEN